MKDFAQAVQFIRVVARAADEGNHHPDIHLTSYRRLTIVCSTHSLGGLSRKDFILAARINELIERPMFAGITGRA